MYFFILFQERRVLMCCAAPEVYARLQQQWLECGRWVKAEIERETQRQE